MQSIKTVLGNLAPGAFFRFGTETKRPEDEVVCLDHLSPPTLPETKLALFQNLGQQIFILFICRASDHSFSDLRVSVLKGGYCQIILIIGDC